MTVDLRHGDCLDVLRQMPDGCVDLTVTSPPYDNLRTYNGFTFDFEGIARELYRVTKPGGVVVWVVGDATIKGSETGTSFRQALFFKDVCGFNLHDTMIYRREGQPLTHNRYEQKFEYMFVLSKGKPNTFNGLREPAKYAGASRASVTMRQDSDALGDRSAKGVVAETRLIGNVWEYGVGFNKSATDKLAYKHPAIFPEQLAADHIASWRVILATWCWTRSSAAERRGRWLFKWGESSWELRLAPNTLPSHPKGLATQSKRQPNRCMRRALHQKTTGMR